MDNVLLHMFSGLVSVCHLASCMSCTFMNVLRSFAGLMAFMFIVDRIMLCKAVVLVHYFTIPSRVSM